MRNRVYEYLTMLLLYLIWIACLYYLLGVMGYGVFDPDVLGICVLVIGAVSIVVVLMARRRDRYIHQAGELEIEELEPGVKTFSLSLNADPEDLVNYERIVFKIKSPS